MDEENLVKNPGAEMGDFSHWQYTGLLGETDVYAGGIDGQFCFGLHSTIFISGEMTQKIPVAPGNTGYLLEADYLPPFDFGSDNHVNWIGLRLKYGDGTETLAQIPCR